MLVVALPLQLPHEFHHSELYVGNDSDLFIHIGCQLQIPDQGVLVWTDSVSRCGTQAVFSCFKACITHTMRGTPLLRLAFARLIGGTPAVIAVQNIGVETAAVGGDMEELIVVDTPDLGGLIKGDTTAGLGHHGVESTVGKIIHPRCWRIIPVNNKFALFIVEILHGICPF